MTSRLPQWLRLNKALVLQCIAFFGIGLLVTGAIVRWRGKFFPSRQGFNFNSRMNDASSGPRIGETVDFTAARAQDGRSLADDLRGTSPSMIVVIDLHCGACKAAHDQMLAVRDKIVSSGIHYYVVMLCKGSNAEQYFAYADSLQLASKSFIWRTDQTQPPASLAGMVIPSHLLLNAEGVVIDKWPGTDQNPDARQRMVNQIAADSIKHLHRPSL